MNRPGRAALTVQLCAALLGGCAGHAARGPHLAGFRAALWEQLMVPTAGAVADAAARGDLGTIAAAEQTYSAAHHRYATGPALLGHPSREPALRLVPGTAVRVVWADTHGFCATASSEAGTRVFFAGPGRAPSTRDCTGRGHAGGGPTYYAPDDRPVQVPAAAAGLRLGAYLDLVVGLRTVLIAAGVSGGRPGVPVRRDDDASVDVAGIRTHVTEACVAVSSVAAPGRVWYARPAAAHAAVSAAATASTLLADLRVGTRTDAGTCGRSTLPVTAMLADAAHALDALTPPGSPLPATLTPTPSSANADTVPAEVRASAGSGAAAVAAATLAAR